MERKRIFHWEGRKAGYIYSVSERKGTRGIIEIVDPTEVKGESYTLGTARGRKGPKKGRKPMPSFCIANTPLWAIRQRGGSARKRRGGGLSLRHSRSHEKKKKAGEKLRRGPSNIGQKERKVGRIGFSQGKRKARGEAFG